MRRFETQEAASCILYVVELAYGTDSFGVTDPTNPRHLQVRAGNRDILWHKENLVNIGVRTLLPPDWQEFAWIDADIEFESTTWAREAVALLRGPYDAVQLWSHADDLDQTEHTLRVATSLGYSWVKSGGQFRPPTPNTKDEWHPGYAWAMNRKAFEQLGGLYEHSIIGSGDSHTAAGLIGLRLVPLHPEAAPEYSQHLQEYQDRGVGLRTGYVPGVIRHHFHGAKVNRQYASRYWIYVRAKYDPYTHLAPRPEDGLLVPTATCPPSLLTGIWEYFGARDEDEAFYDASGVSIS